MAASPATPAERSLGETTSFFECIFVHLCICVFVYLCICIFVYLYFYLYLEYFCMAASPAFYR